MSNEQKNKKECFAMLLFVMSVAILFCSIAVNFSEDIKESLLERRQQIELKKKESGVALMPAGSSFVFFPRKK